MTVPIAVLDLPWLLTDTARHPMHVAGLIVCRPPDGATPMFMDDLMRDLRADTSVVDPFDRVVHRRGRGRVWPRWATVPAVDTRERVRRVALPGPGGQRELETMVARLHEQRLDKTEPLWQLHVIEGLAAGRFAIYAKFHHSLVDGVGAVRLLESWLSTDADDLGTRPFWAVGRGVAGPARRLRPRRPRHVRLVVVVRGIRAAVRNVADRTATRPYTAPASILNTSISKDRNVGVRSFDLARLRELAGSVNGTVNDVYLSVCAAALRRYLSEQHTLPDRALTAAIPVSVRPDDGHDLGNAITFAFTTLATDEADLRARTLRIATSMAGAKRRLATIGTASMNAYTVTTMAPFIVSQLAGAGARTPPMFNVAISNLPGPSQALFSNGSAVEAIHPVSVLQAGQALNITALSYLDQLHVTITACGTRLPHIDRLAGYCADALLELEAEFTGPGSRPTRSAA